MSEILDELRTALAGQYEIENELGEGGMALVFLARDVKHDRQVAVKILKPELAANLGAERFLREIQITAKLSHPHILPLYDSGLADGYLFYVMPFVEGEPLGSYLEREKQLSIEETLKFTREVAEALAYAHARGLVHRDIKPDNIFLSGGHAIVADFGIARAFTSAGGEQLTQTGMAVGTPAYMSPEQAAGEAELDGRTDVYALGCVMYEMLVGEIPFTGPNAMAIMARHSMDMITAPHIMRQAIPEDVEDIIYTAMAKTPADRFRTAQDMVEAIEAVERGTGSKVAGTARLSQGMRMSAAQRSSALHRSSGLLDAPRPLWRRAAPIAAAVVVAGVGVGAWQLLGNGRSAPGVATGGLPPTNVAVRYFEDLSRDSSLAYLADGLTEGLIRQLGDVPELNVRSIDAVTPFRDPSVSRDSVAQVLEAGTLVEGSVEPVGERIRVNVRLFDGSSGVEVPDGRASIELPAAAATRLQDSVARTVALELRRRLGQEVRLREQRARTTSDAAWTLVQRAQKLRKDGQTAFAAGRADEGFAAYAHADSLLAQAEALDPGWVEPTLVRARLAYDLIRPDRERRAARVQEALAHVQRALAKDPRHPTALELRGATRFLAVRADLADNLAQQEAWLDSAAADLLAAGSASAFATLSSLDMFRGEKVDAILHAQQAYERDAYLDVADDVLRDLFWGYYDREQFDNARRWCQIGRQRFPTDPRFAECALTLLMTDGAPDVARAWSLAGEMVAHSTPRDSAFNRALGQMSVAGVLARADLADSARAVVARAQVSPRLDPSGTVTFTEAYVRILLGDADGAIRRLKSYLTENPEQHHGLGGQGNLYWWWRPLQSHPDFAELIQG